MYLLVQLSLFIHTSEGQIHPQPSSQPGQEVRAANIREEADTSLWHGKDSALGGHAVLAMHWQAYTATHGDACTYTWGIDYAVFMLGGKFKEKKPE